MDKFDKNPFLEKLNGVMYIRPRANVILAQGESIVDTTTGEIVKEKHPLIGSRKLMDSSQFGKMYAKSIGLMMDFKANTVKVLVYFLGKIDYENKVIFSYSKEYTKLGYKNASTVYRGIKELINNNVIAQHSNAGIWWVNPLFICKGERFSIYTEYIKDKGGTTKDAVENVLNKPLKKGEDPTKQMRTFDSKGREIRQITIEEGIEAKEKEA